MNPWMIAAIAAMSSDELEAVEAPYESVRAKYEPVRARARRFEEALLSYDANPPRPLSPEDVAKMNAAKLKRERRCARNLRVMK